MIPLYHLWDHPADPVTEGPAQWLSPSLLAPKGLSISRGTGHYTQLTCLTQVTAYKLISRIQNPSKIRWKATLSNLNLARETIYNLENTHPTDKHIWKAILSNRRDLSTNVRNFLWKLIHDAHRCGHYWLKMINLSERGICPKCETPETMQHIIFNCEANQCEIIWKIAKDICERKNIAWPSGLDITTIMALPLLKVRSENGETRQGATRLLLIVISECAFLIWKLRCRRLLDTSPETPERTTSAREACNMTLSTINSRLEQDRILTSKKRYEKRAFPEELILKTWSGTLQNEHSLPENWLCTNGVLVGIPLWIEEHLTNHPRTPRTHQVAGVGWVPHDCA